MKFFNVTWPLGEDRFASAAFDRRSFGDAAVDTARAHAIGDHDVRDERRRHPLVMRWEPGSAEVAELVWVWGYLVVQTAPLDELLDRFSGACAMPVEMVQDPKLGPPKRITARTTPRVWLPYQGPDLAELWSTRWVDLDWEASSTVAIRTCSCGFRYWDPVGHERVDLFESDAPEVERLPRDPSAGLQVRASDLDGDAIFRIAGYHGNWLMVTEPVKGFSRSEAGGTSTSWRWAMSPRTEAHRAALGRLA